MENVKIVRSQRRSMMIHVSSQGEVIVKVPHLVPKFIIERFVLEKRDWIEKTLQKVQKRMPKKKAYQEGETFLFLGQTVKLKLSNTIQMQIKNNELLFPKALTFRIQKELETWYKNQAMEIITSRLESRSKEMSTVYFGVFFSDTSSKWGTCLADNRLQFNWRLIMAPLMVLDYVIIHELSHTIHKNHGRNFWAMVGRFTPAYRQHRKWLSDNAHLLTI